MALVIAHAELVSDQTSDPRTAPQRRREAVRLGAFQQQRLEAFELRGVQQRLTAGAAGLAQPGFAVTPVSSQPLADALPRDLQSPRCLGLTTALLDQPDRFETALLQGLEIPPYAFCISHTYKDVRTPKRCHFILRDSIDRIGAKCAAARGVSLEDYMREVKEEPTGRLVLPSEVAKMAFLLASEDCASVNGSSVVIDGGMIA